MLGTNITLSFVSSFRAPRCLALSDAIVLLTAIFHASVHPTVILHTPASHFPRETSLIDTIICIIFLGDVQASSKVHMASAQRPLMAHANVTRISLKLCFYFPNVAAAQRGFSSDISAAIDGRILQRLSSRDGSGDWCWWRNLGHHGDLWKLLTLVEGLLCIDRNFVLIS